MYTTVKLSVGYRLKPGQIIIYTVQLLSKCEEKTAQIVFIK